MQTAGAYHSAFRGGEGQVMNVSDDIRHIIQTKRWVDIRGLALFSIQQTALSISKVFFLIFLLIRLGLELGLRLGLGVRVGVGFGLVT